MKTVALPASFLPRKVCDLKGCQRSSMRMKIQDLECLRWESQNNLVLGNIIQLMMYKVWGLWHMPKISFVTKQEILPFWSKQVSSFMEEETTGKSYKIFRRYLRNREESECGQGVLYSQYTWSTFSLQMQIVTYNQKCFGAATHTEVMLKSRMLSWRLEKWMSYLWYTRQCQEAITLLNYSSLDSGKSRKHIYMALKLVILL